MKLRYLILGTMASMLLLAGCTTPMPTDNSAQNGGDAEVVCTAEYDPVCGVDGQTYSNECMATNQGVSIAYVGECTSADLTIPEVATYQIEPGIDSGEFVMEAGSMNYVEIMNPPEGVFRVRIPQTDWEVIICDGDSTVVELPVIEEPGYYAIDINTDRAGTLRVI